MFTNFFFNFFVEATLRALGPRTVEYIPISGSHFGLNYKGLVHTYG